MPSVLNVAAIGVGTVAQFHLDALSKQPDVRIAGVCDIDRDKADAAASRFGGPAFEDMGTMLDAVRPDAVFIMTPPTVRVEPLSACCVRGIPFFCEKPPAFTPEDAAQIRALLHRSGVLHTIGFMWRHLRLADEVKARLGDRAVSLAAHTFINGPLLHPIPAWFRLKERSGGPVFDQAIHLIDVSRYVLGDILRVGAVGNNLVAPKDERTTVEDSLALLLDYECGTSATYIHGWAHEGISVSTRFVGKDFDLTAAWHDGVLGGMDRGEPVKESFGDNSYRTEIERFLHAVRERDASVLRSDYRDAVKTLSVAWAAEKSLQTGLLEGTKEFWV